MPQYKKIQYGLKQYGLFIPTTGSGRGSRFQFIKARFGIVKRGKTYWLYQHPSVTVKGVTSKLRLTTNKGERITEEQMELPGRHPLLRIKANKQTNWVLSPTLEREETPK